MCASHNDEEGWSTARTVPATDGGERVPRAGVYGFSSATLRRIMSRLGVQPDELAEVVGVSRQSVSAWLNSTTVPSASSLAAVASALGVGVEELTPGLDEDAVQIADLRARCGKSQSAAASALAISRTSLGEFERGQRRELPDSAADAMAELYGVSRGVVDSAWENTRAARVRQVAERRAARRGRN